MKRILMRAGKEPWTPIGPEASLSRALLGSNSGNAIFSYSAFRTLSTEDTEITANYFKVDPKKADEINEKYDVFVVPLANAFRLSFAKSLDQLTALISRLKIRVVVLGVGAQSSLDYDLESLKPIEGSVKKFISAVLDRSDTLGVRGEFTENYVRKLGYSAVDMIGCPSMFLHGDAFAITKKIPALKRDSKVAINVSPYVAQMSDILALNLKRYANLVYIPQDDATLKNFVWGEPEEARQLETKAPVHLSHPVFKQNKAKFFIDPTTWISFLREYEFAFGTRIHGNITALLAGVPSYVIAHDSRTRELVEYFQIPHSLLKDLPSKVDAAELYEKADYSDLNRGHAARFKRYTDFLEKNRLDHVFMPGKNANAFDKKMAGVTFPAGIGPMLATESAVLCDRIRWLNKRNEIQMKNMNERVQTLEKLMTKKGWRWT